MDREPGRDAGRKSVPGPHARSWSLDTKVLFKEAKTPVRCINSSGGFKFHNPTEIEVNKKYADYNAVLINDVGHYPMLEKPDEFNKKLREILKEFAAK